jgi:2-polyprenyl-3-methyl-5-hydroxy-6-metoxy-1,4-benzoquinol methylase
MELLSLCCSGFSNVRFYDMKRRTCKAQKVGATIYDYIGQELNELRCLDIRGSTGMISSFLTEIFNSVIGLDLDVPIMRWAQKNSARSNTCFIFADRIQTSSPIEMFEVVVCAQCYEHMTDARRLMDEVNSLLKSGSGCFFSGPNRLAFVEDHYGIPFLSWLPRPLANAYIRLAKCGQFYKVRPLTYREFRNLWKNLEIQDYTLSIPQEPEKYRIEKEDKGVAWLGHLPDWFLRILLVFAPNDTGFCGNPCGDPILPEGY